MQGLFFFNSILVSIVYRYSALMARNFWRAVSATPVVIVAETFLLGFDSILYPGAGVCVGDVVLCNRRIKQQPLSIGENVVFRSPFDPRGNAVGQVVGLEGTVYVNNQTSENLDLASVRHNHVLIDLDYESQPSLPSQSGKKVESPRHPAAVHAPASLIGGRPIAVVWPPQHMRIILPRSLPLSVPENI